MNPCLSREEQFSVRQRHKEELTRRILAKYQPPVMDFWNRVYDPTRRFGDATVHPKHNQNPQNVINPPDANGVEHWTRSTGEMHTPEASLVEWFDAHSVEKRAGEEVFGSKWNTEASGRRKMMIEEEADAAEGSDFDGSFQDQAKYQRRSKRAKRSKLQPSR